MIFFYHKNGGVGSCEGDSGGPLVHFAPDGLTGVPRYVQVR